MKIKTLLFGAGEGSKNFIHNKYKEREYLAIVDNDTSRVGTFFENIIIISPEEIKNYEYDEIVIVTQWVEEVKEQLINVLKISEDKIFIPPKNILKNKEPFMDKNTLELANNILKTISLAAYKEDIELFIDSGTLLGIVRDGTIMPWDDDIDFAVNISNKKNQGFDIKSWVDDVLKKSDLPVDFDVSAIADKNNKIVDIAIDFTSNKYNSFRTSVKIRKEIGGKSVEQAALGLYYAPSKHFKKYEILTWQDIKLKVPFDYMNYLTFVYGDWKKVKKSITLADYSHLGDVSFEDFQEAGFHKVL